jgi:hypothetical protein
MILWSPPQVDDEVWAKLGASRTRRGVTQCIGLRRPRDRALFPIPAGFVGLQQTPGYLPEQLPDIIAWYKGRAVPEQERPMKAYLATGQIARALHIGTARVQAWVSRYPDFPEPDVTLLFPARDAVAGWDDTRLDEIRAWAARLLAQDETRGVSKLSDDELLRRRRAGATWQQLADADGTTRGAVRARWERRTGARC